MDKYKIVCVNEANAALYPQIICFINAKHPAHPIKIEWLKQRFAEGMQIKVVSNPGNNNVLGLIEFVPGEYAWRAVSATGYLFIHCLWIASNANKNKGLGSALIQETIFEAKQLGLNGVAVLCSNDAFMAKSDVFVKNGFHKVESAASKYSLMVYKLKNAADPRLNDWQKELAKYNDLHLIYSKQCPWVARVVVELEDYAKEKGLHINLHELKSAKEAQNAPSPYATFNLVYNGRLLADHYISLTRFSNILKKAELG